MPSPPMSDPRPTDQSQRDALRNRLDVWLERQRQAVLEEATAAWQSALSRLRPDEALLAELISETTPPATAPAVSEQRLATALDLVECATSQGDLLRRLLEALAPLAPRSAIYILRQGQPCLYSHQGFEDQAATKAGGVLPTPDLEDLIQGRSPSVRHRSLGYTALVSTLSAFEAADIAIFPLRHRRKTVALLLVDSDLLPRLPHPELVRALVLATSALLASLAAGKEEESKAAPAAPPPAPAPVQEEARVPEAPPSTILDPQTRAAAERLARVLVEDLELYFPTQVTQARAQGNLYPLLRPELDRSRATFVDRFGEDIENNYRIFTTTLIHQLCNDDASKLGSAPWA